MNKIKLEIISPELILADLEVTMAVLPGESGEFGVLYRHENLITTVKPGVVYIYQGDVQTEKYLVSCGTVKITGDLCTIIVDEAENCENINFDEFETRLVAAKQELETETSEVIRTEISNKVKYLEEGLRFRG